MSLNSSSLNKFLACLMVISVLILLLPPLVTADAWATIETKMSEIICGIKDVFAVSASGVAAFVIALAAIQWISSESDPGVRKKAKTSMVHAIVGLIIVMLARDIAEMVLTVSCPP